MTKPITVILSPEDVQTLKTEVRRIIWRSLNTSFALGMICGMAVITAIWAGTLAASQGW